jgi:GNAT superfamily N-acetyltransferase
LPHPVLIQINDIIVDVIIRPANPADSSTIRRICEQELDLEPDAGELPDILRRPPGRFCIVAETAGAVVGVCFGSLGRPGSGQSAGPSRGHVDLLAVARAARGRGTGKRLLSGMESLLRDRGATVVLLSGNPPTYLWPGVDVRYTVMTCLAERAGYEKYSDGIDMTVDLGGVDPLDTQAEAGLATAGIQVRRATGDEAGPLVDWLRSGPWGASAWPDEVAAALAHEPSGCHVACRDSRYVGFACHGVGRRGWFGPMGTEESERQHGIGSVLLKRCLADMKAAGQQSARIGWVGPVRFYVRTVDARVERVYWLYRKAL